jgi:hypothetical protein
MHSLGQSHVIAPYAERRAQANTMREAAQALISTVREIRTKTCMAYTHISFDFDRQGSCQVELVRPLNPRAERT